MPSFLAPAALRIPHKRIVGPHRRIPGGLPCNRISMPGWRRNPAYALASLPLVLFCPNCLYRPVPLPRPFLRLPFERPGKLSVRKSFLLAHEW